MKIWTFSDTHVDHGVGVSLSVLDVDVIVIAGDWGGRLCASIASIDGFMRQSHISIPVIYVPGNHDYYGAVFEEERAKGIDLARDYMPDNFHLLDRSSVTIQGVDFHGVTLWTDYALDGDRDLGMIYADRGMNDARCIRRMDGEPFRARDTLVEHKIDRAYLDSVVRPGSVVVTHHLPSPSCIASEYKGSTLNAAFASDLDGFIDSREPAAWLFGHTHTSHDDVLGSTRLVCNPRGYPRKIFGRSNVRFENSAFDPRKVVEIA